MEKDTQFIKIDYENWDRKDIYISTKDLLYYVTVEIDITHFLKKIKDENLKFYPAINYLISKVVNENYEFRYSVVDNEIGYWSRVEPLYTLLRKNSDHLYTHNFTKYTPNFLEFYSNFLIDADIAENSNKLYPDNMPKNLLCTSIMPTTSFKALSFNYNVKDSTEYIPFVTVGKFFSVGDKILLPVCTEFHHEVNDGYHAEKFFKLLQQEADVFNF